MADVESAVLRDKEREFIGRSKKALRERRENILYEAIDNATKSLGEKITHKSIPAFFRFMVAYSNESSQEFKSLYRSFMKTNLPESLTNKIISKIDARLEESGPAMVDIKDKMDYITRKQKLYDIISEYDLQEFNSLSDYKDYLKRISSYLLSGAGPVYYLLLGKASGKLLSSVKGVSKEDPYESITYSGYLQELSDEKGNYKLREEDSRQKLISKLEDILGEVQSNPRIVKDFGLRYKDIYEAHMRSGFFGKGGSSDILIKAFFDHGRGLYLLFSDWQKDLMESRGNKEFLEGFGLSFDELKQLYETKGLFETHGLINHIANSYYHMDNKRVLSFLQKTNLFLDQSLGPDEVHTRLHEEGLFGKEGLLSNLWSVFLEHGAGVYGATVLGVLEESIENTKSFGELSEKLSFDQVKSRFDKSSLFRKDGLLYYFCDSILEHIDEFKPYGKLNRGTVGLVLGAIKGAILTNENLYQQDIGTKLNKYNEFALQIGKKANETGRSEAAILNDYGEYSNAAKAVYGSIDNYASSLQPFKEIEDGLVWMLGEIANNEWKDGFSWLANYFYKKEIDEQNATAFVDKAASTLDSNLREQAIFYREFLKEKSILYKREHARLLNP